MKFKKENVNVLDDDQTSNDSDPQSRPFIPFNRQAPSKRFWYTILLILATSLVLNIISLGLALKIRALKTRTCPILITEHSTESLNEIPSPFANLTRNTTTPYVLLTDYASPNTSLSDPLWNSINIDAGVIALSDSYAESHNLRTAQRFPWDTSKGIYIIHGYHNLHCLKIIHISLSEFRSNKTQSRSWHHISHCIDALRRQILCDADDTPRATERRKEVVTGIGQYRQCRDWGALEEWAKRHTACYKRPLNGDDGLPVIERFKHCPPDSGYVVEDEYVPEEEVLVGLPGENVALGETEGA
ncbi:hypothetical protein BDV19DRAFT_365048 [Aspergillus venezuelensis]